MHILIRFLLHDWCSRKSQAPRRSCGRSSPVIRLRLRMDEYLKEFRSSLLKANLESCRNVVYLGKREIVRQCRVAREVKAVAYALEHHFVEVDDLGKLSNNFA